jgi:hypothetical protein
MASNGIANGDFAFSTPVLVPNGLSKIKTKKTVSREVCKDGNTAAPLLKGVLQNVDDLHALQKKKASAPSTPKSPINPSTPRNMTPRAAYTSEEERHKQQMESIRYQALPTPSEIMRVQYSCTAFYCATFRPIAAPVHQSNCFECCFEICILHCAVHCSASLASLTREIGPQVIKGDPAAGKRSPPRSVVAPRLHMTDSALKFTHILYNLSPAGTVVPFSSFLFLCEQVHFLGSRCSLIFVVSSQHQFQLPPWSRYCWVMRTFQCLLSLKCFRTTHITPHTPPWREACPGLSRGKIAAAVMFPNLPFLGLRDWSQESQIGIICGDMLN